MHLPSIINYKYLVIFHIHTLNTSTIPPTYPYQHIHTQTHTLHIHYTYTTHTLHILMKIHLFILYIIYKYYLLLYIHTYIPNTLPKQKQTIITLTYSLILLHHLLPTYSYIILSTLKDSNPQSPNPKLGAFTNLAKDATYYSTIHKKKFNYVPLEKITFYFLIQVENRFL